MINLFTSDPLLGGNQPNYQQQIEELNRMRSMLEEQKRAFEQKQQIAQTANEPTGKESLWTTIDHLTDELSDKEKEAIMGEGSYQQSQARIVDLMNQAYMRLVRPIVEQSEEGRKALADHLSLMKQLRKEVAKRSEKNLELFNEYTDHYADMTYSDFLRMKRNTPKS